MSRAFVTGATGFIGGAVVRALLRRGFTVRVLVRPQTDTAHFERSLAQVTGGSGAPPPPVERWRGDLADADSIRGCLDGCDTLFHVAARYTLWNPRPAEIYRANVDGTRHVLEEARRAGVGKVVYTCTVGTLAIPPDNPGDETRRVDLAALRGHYKRSKWLAEEEALRFAAEGLPLILVKPSAPVGPFDVKPTPTGRMIVDFLRGFVHAYTDTGLNLVDVDDCARGHLLAAERGRPGEAYILGAENHVLPAIYAMLAELSGVRAPRLRLPFAALVPIAAACEGFARVSRRPPMVSWEALEMARKRMFFDSGKACRELGYRPGSVRAALARAALWFYENGYARTRRVEVTERLRLEAGNGLKA